MFVGFMKHPFWGAGVCELAAHGISENHAQSLDQRLQGREMNSGVLFIDRKGNQCSRPGSLLTSLATMNTASGAVCCSSHCRPMPSPRSD